MNDQEINDFVHDQHVKLHEVMTERIKAETLAERRFSAAVAAMQTILSEEYHGKMDEHAAFTANKAVKYADALLAALEEKK